MAQPPAQNPNQNSYGHPDQAQPSYPQANHYPPSAPAYPSRQPGYPQQPGNYAPPLAGQRNQGAAYAAAPVKKGKWFLYLIPALGVVAMVLGVFLPWFNVTILGSTVSLNGMGNLSGPSELTSILSRDGSSGVKDGVLVLGLAGISSLLILGGLLMRARGFAIAVIVFGLMSLGLTAFEVIDANRSIQAINNSAAGAATAQTGLGLYVGLAGAVVVLVGAIVTLVFFKSGRSRA